MAEKNKKAKKQATLDALLSRAEQSRADKTALFFFSSEELDMELPLVKLRLTEFLNMLDNVDDIATMSEHLEYYKELIYKHCPLLQRKELRDAYDCAEPYDVVVRVFNDNMSEISKCASTITSIYGLGDEVEQIKN